MRIEDDVREITEFQVPALVLLQDMKANVLEATEEAFAYPLLNASVEKEEFFERTSEFNVLASEFTIIAHIGSPGEEEETILFEKILDEHSKLVANTRLMFADFEREGVVNIQSVNLVEESVDAFILLLDGFVAIEKAEVDEAALDAEETIAETINIVIAMGLTAVFTGSINNDIHIPTGDLDCNVSYRTDRSGYRVGNKVREQ